MMNLPNVLTLARIGVVPILVLMLYFPGPAMCFAAMMVFILASVTDVADGLLARQMGLVTNLGKFLDPLADKLLIGSVMIMLVRLGWVEAWVAVLIIGREMAVTGLRAVASDQGIVIAADKFGKLKTIIQTFALCPLILHFPVWGVDPQPFGDMLLYVALGLTIGSGANYMYGFFKNWQG
ncbi:CDP-diacylglycerol--glycerol-3-phosphate 3-phosphatidyltransferase [Fundidesulfovibrio terrae]|uniref:CDP-diacylglycerol--glycerol-3-phosphate 3-phosphatidyltransferase n=1 Tax=Fundidesulfovibrio terrae TaxID=2922866 RepID=UPI001FAEA056|nr:CDP-diacylglycerol--glycerol-3-phosphate 3-phosphatidyltransferase [Fundidesulfovibrio terrae]